MKTNFHVCLITPRHLCANPRVVKEAAALNDANIRVTIVCGNYLPLGTQADVKLSSPKWNTKHVAFGKRVAPIHLHLLQRAQHHFARGLAALGLDSAEVLSAAHSPVGLDLVRACDVSADLYVAHYVAALPAAAAAARRFSAHYAFDAEDFHLGDLPDTRKHRLEKDIIRAIERRYLPGASYVTTASPMIAEAYEQEYAIALPRTILNVFPRSGAPECPTPRGNNTPGPSVYWFSQTIGPGRGLEKAIQAIGLAKCQPHLFLRGTPVPGYAAVLRDLATQHAVSPRLHFLPPVSADILERQGAQFDVGLVSELNETRNRQIALTNKLFSYLTSGLPIVASDIPSHRRIAPDFGLAMSLFPIGDAADLAKALDELLLQPLRLAEARALAWDLGQNRYSWDREKLKFQSIVSQILLAN